MVNAEAQAISFGALGTVNGTNKLIASVIVGIIWTAISPLLEFIFAALLMGLATFFLARRNRTLLNKSAIQSKKFTAK
ncbi:hypothetical protein [Pseudomonas koreensis]|jgi:hypothetical protein|uniref:hypothetical protein n=1 Tax=Pseudomonas koreensis TaxID=198620 RepID=UPI000FDA0464|nr:hypothetical protein [Pseudomonas koreensis]